VCLIHLFIIFVSLITYLETVAGDIECRLIAIKLSRLIRQIRYFDKALAKKILFKTIKVIRYSQY
jgi:hypothetical protein